MDNSDVISSINEIILALKIYEKRKIFIPLHKKLKFSIKDFLVNMTKSTFGCGFG